MVFGLIPLLFACVSQGENVGPDIELSVQKVVEENGYKLISLDPTKSNGIRITNLNELDELLKTISGKELEYKYLGHILSRNSLKELPQLNFNSLEITGVESTNSSIQNRIQCLHNWQNVYGRIGIGGGAGSTYIDFGFTVGTGSGFIENWNATLEGNTFMLGLGKNDFRNNGPLFGGFYSGTYHFTVKIVLFFEGVGEIWTYQNKKVDIKVEACSGVVTYTFVEE